MDDNENLQNLDFNQIININEEEKTIYFDQNFQQNDSTLKFTEIMELKEEKKENKSALQFHWRSPDSDEHDYMKPLVDDYINCEHRNIMNCHAIKRTLHLLRYYDKLQTETRF
eukprot:384606_1